MRPCRTLAPLASLCMFTACVNPQPMTAGTSFVPEKEANASVTPGACRLRILHIHDDRLDPTVLGQVAGRAVRAPSNEQAWLRSVLAGMRSLSVGVVFAPQAQKKSGDMEADVALERVWVASEATAKTAGVVMRFTFLQSGTVVRQRDYRGGVSTPNWNSGTEEIQRMINEAFARALRQAADDSRALCASSAHGRSATAAGRKATSVRDH